MRTAIFTILTYICIIQLIYQSPVKADDIAVLPDDLDIALPPKSKSVPSNKTQKPLVAHPSARSTDSAGVSTTLTLFCTFQIIHPSGKRWLDEDTFFFDFRRKTWKSQSETTENQLAVNDDYFILRDDSNGSFKINRIDGHLHLYFAPIQMIKDGSCEKKDAETRKKLF